MDSAVVTEREEFVLIITGSRDWTDRRSVWTPLDRLRGQHGRLLIRNGKARKGADALVSEWCEENRRGGVTERPYPADWGGSGGKGAGFVRNGAMVDAGANAVLAWANPCRKNSTWCPPGPHPSHGTADCVRKARTAGIPVHFCPLGMKW